MYLLALWTASVPLPPPPPLLEPTALPREDRPASGRSPRYFRSARERPRWGGRLGLGVAGNVAGPVPARNAFVLDLAAVGRVSFSRRRPQLLLLPELGYAHMAGRQHTRGHLVTVGLGLGYGLRGASVAVVPRFVAGSLLDQRALGVRTGLLAEIVKTGGFGVELGHQALFLPGAVAHAVMFHLFAGFYVPTVR